MDKLHDYWYISWEVTRVAPVLLPQILDSLLVWQSRRKPTGVMNEPALLSSVMIILLLSAEIAAARADAILLPVKNRVWSKPRGGRAKQGLCHIWNRKLGNQRVTKHF